MTFKSQISLLFNLIKTTKENKVLLKSNFKYYKIRDILKILERYGLIHYYLIKDNTLLLYKNPSKMYEIHNFKDVKYFSAYKLRSFIRKNPANVYVVSTTLGLIDGFKASINNLGGYLVFIIKVQGNILR